MKRDIGREAADSKKQTEKSKHWLLHQRAGAGETTNRVVQRLKCCSKCTCKIPLAGSDEKARCHQLCWLCIVRAWGEELGVVGVGGEGEGGSWVPYPEAKILPSLGSSTSPRPSTHTRELKIPFTPTGARSWLEKARDKKRFSTEQNHHNGRTLICNPPPPHTSPLLPVPIELCHHATVIQDGTTLLLWMKWSTAI